MNTNELELSRHEQAQSLHQRIMTSGSLAAQNLWDMCIGLKEMRDKKLYKELGYSNFETYCTEMCGFSDRNARNYISIIENISEENRKTFSGFGMGKLMLLAQLSEEKQQKISEKVDLESVSVRELKEEINKLKGEKMLIENEREKLNAKLEAEAANAEEARSDLERAEKELKVAQIKSAAEMDRANRTADKLRDKEREAARLERENKELRERPVEVAVVDNSDSERRLQETIRSLERENMKRNEEMDRQYIKDRRELEAQKTAEIEAIREEYEEKLKAVQTGGESKDKQEFKVFLVMAHDALDRLISAANGKEDIYKTKVKELLRAAEKKLEV